MIEEKLNKLNAMQKEAVLNTEGAMLILAGAGSGKTRVLTHKIAYLIEKGVRPFNILAITFTNKAAKEMKERASAICNDGKEVLISTFHSLCVRILRRDIAKIEYTSRFTIYDTEDSEKIIKEIMKEFLINDDILNSKMVLNEISRQKDNLINSLEYEKIVQGDFKKKQIAEIYKEYEKRLKSNNALDFDDLIFKTIELLVKNPDVLEDYQERFKYIMVDEYQDTSYSQYTLIKLLANKYKNICVVGDDDQSIYSFRGADIKNILGFEDDFKGTKVIKLEQNYRSTKTILETANIVIRNNFARKDKTLWTENESGDLIYYESFQNEKEEAAFVVKEIMQKVKKEGFSYNDFAILYRSNNLSRYIEESFVVSGLPYKIYGGVNFYSRKEIKDIISYLKVLENPNDEMCLKRIINIPKRGIGEATIAKLNEYAIENNLTLFETLKYADEVQDLGRQTKIVLDFYNLMQDFKQKAEDTSISDFIKYILDKTGYILELEKEGTEEAYNRISNINELISKAVEYENTFEDGKALLTDFLEEIALVSDIDSLVESDEIVSLMTMHRSKGLEFPFVFIVGFEEGIFPTYGALTSGNPSDIEEERRLFYVAITRAKRKLYITNSKGRMQYGRFVCNSTSSFFKELPIQNLEIKKEVKNNKISFTAQEKEGIYRPKPSYKPNISAYLKKEMPIKNISLDFEVGDMVKHFKFGVGKVLKIDPAGADYEITINFENFGDKKLMANLSKLKKA